MQSVIIPIRFSKSDQLILKQKAAASGQTLSAYIRSKVIDTDNNSKKQNKTQALLDRLNQLNISKDDIDQAMNSGLEFRKNFKLINSK